jgi:hypothetical protein
MTFGLTVRRENRLKGSENEVLESTDVDENVILK